MQRSLKLRNFKISKFQNPQRGYMMITVMLALAMITIALLTVLPDMKQQIRRDREEEMRRRGTAYMRAIQHYFRKYNAYPTSIEQLENTNNLRFLRKRYTDPTNRDPATGKERDFKILHQTDISLNNGPVLGPTTPGPGGPAVQPTAFQPTGATVQQKGDSGNSSSSNPPSGNPSSDNPSDAGENPNSPGSSSTSNPSSSSSSGFNGPTLGGGPIVGVASMSKEKTIRVFYGKNRYKDWLFIYVPQADQGGLLKGPVNPGMPTANLNGAVNPGQANPNSLTQSNPSQPQGLSSPLPQTPTQTPTQQ